jgi:hypothetical protein
MWSHYGDQHNGLCIGYSALADALPDLHIVRYGGSRIVKASAVARMLDGDSAARTVVDGAVLLRKAIPWGYEKEWRLIGPRGVNASPLEMEEIVFGMRCTAAVKYAVVKALEDRDRAVRFYEIREQRKRACHYDGHVEREPDRGGIVRLGHDLRPDQRTDAFVADRRRIWWNWVTHRCCLHASAS